MNTYSGSTWLFFIFFQGIIKKFKLNKIKIRNWIYQVIGTKTHTHTQGWTKILTSLGGPKYKQNNNKKKKKIPNRHSDGSKKNF